MEEAERGETDATWRGRWAGALGGAREIEGWKLLRAAEEELEECEREEEELPPTSPADRLAEVSSYDDQRRRLPRNCSVVEGEKLRHNMTLEQERSAKGEGNKVGKERLFKRGGL